LFPYLDFFSSVLGIEPRVFAHAKQVFHHLRQAPRLFSVVLFWEHGLAATFAQHSLKLVIFLPPFPEELGLQA
jgi:hypothetical protein